MPAGTSGTAAIAAPPHSAARPSIVPTGTVTLLVANPSAEGEVVQAFEKPADAIGAALERQATGEASSRVPGMALHTGDARVRDDGRYVGPAARTAEHLAAIAGPGQLLLSAAATEALGDALPAGSSLVDLGLHRLRDLSSPIRVFELQRQELAAPRAVSAPLRSLDHTPNNLPVHLTGFVGRRTELAAVRALLRTERLVTLTGAGGAGKTRLAAQAAADQADRWPGGVWWVELASLAASPTVGEAIARQIAAASGVLVEPTRGALRSLAVQLRDRRTLISLDNCEHVLDGAAEVASALLHACPELSILATSREPLGTSGEVVWLVPPLAKDDALTLFVERASAVRPWFTLDQSSEAAVLSMCARLDGIPLALELAAAWLRTLTPQQIESGLDRRFSLLVRGPRRAAPRQQTLAASIDWSHALLDESDRIVFRRLAVFPGSFDLDAARSVCADAASGAGDPTAAVTPEDVVDALGRLVDKSLVVAEQRDGIARYHLLETIRIYAADRLAEAAEREMTRDRHLDHYLALAEASEPERRRDMDSWRTRLELEHDNLRAALDWGLSAPDPERGRGLAAALPWLWHLGRHGRAGMDYLQRAAGRAPDDRSRLQARLLTGIALVADTASPLDLEYDAAQRALEIATELGDDGLRALCLVLAAVGQFYTDFDAAWNLTVEALHAAAAGDTFVTNAATALQGIILHLRDRHWEAEPLLQSAVDGLLQQHRGIAATTLGFQASGALYTGDIERARRLAERAGQVAEPLGDYLRVGGTRSVLALVHGSAGDVEAGLEVLRPVLRLIEGAEDEIFISGLPHAVGQLHLWRGDPEHAATWFEREARATDRGADTWLAAQSLAGLGAALRLLGRGEEAARVLERAVAIARRLGMPRVVADALEQQAHLATDGDDAARAIELHHEALALRAEHGLRAYYAASLDALAALGARAAPADLPLDEAVAYVRRSRGARRRPTAGWGSLTPTELDVVRLVVEGLNNPEIGKRLFMSRGTVKTHLAHVYAKLGVGNRTELATLAAGRLAAS